LSGLYYIYFFFLIIIIIVLQPKFWLSEFSHGSKQLFQEEVQPCERG